ncbi:TauD/TfdA family dioxygenase [Roseiarcaceae bacterium H3SJ34-1]|uniref:TauD/TfdA dioxygenase family protein n=1 Tax=Terripilifer ovatus TaxID=3032367 RepID=UPI003AB99794|nr:TauD/TfdA family dioxygenase [Roseiarcaceae bacterium H3SJ34-1]
MTVEIIPLAKHIGAEIRGVDLGKPIDPSLREQIHEAWLKNIVLLFRDQKLTQQDLLDATAVFGKIGKLGRPKEFRPAGYDSLLENIMLISNIRENGEPIGALPDGEMMFHHDMLHAEIPHKGTCLYSVEVPSSGGNTVFANGYAAYETLPEEVKLALDGKRAFHHYNYGTTKKGANNGVAAFSESTHPIFRTHEDTGRKTIYVNRLMTVKIEGMLEDESNRLLEQVYDHSEKPEWRYEHVWRPGDLLVWDNRCSMHARTDFSAGERRLMLRTTIEGNVRPY